MCGIAGLIYPKAEGAVSEAALLPALAELRPRGPDDQGVWLNKKKNVGFGHTRLAVLDTSAHGRQPMVSAEASALTYNGEIYNFRELLRGRLGGRALKSQGDSEVLLLGLEKFGPDFIHELDGMFAFAFYDPRAERVLLGVDPAGEKPLYTYWDGTRFAFASEIKALFALLGPEGDFAIDREALSESLAFGYVPFPRTVYRNIRKLPAGHFQFVDLNVGPHSAKTYWDIPLGERELKLTAKEAGEQLRALIAGAVKKRLVADVPIGSFLSGGLDSSIVSLEAARALAPERLKTFSASFPGRENAYFDESIYARQVARLIGSDHVEVSIPVEGIDAEKIIKRFDEPYGDSSAIPTYLLCEETAKHVKVVLTGDGGDELFGGYLRFRAALISENYQSLWRLALTPLMPLKSKPFSLLSRLQRFNAATKLSSLERIALWSAFFTEKDLNQFLNHKVERTSAEMRRWDEKTHGLPLGKKVLYYNFKTYLFDDLLPKVDRMSMSHGLELRAPFLDKALIEFAFRLPTNYKFDALNTKKILKSAYDRDLGRGITRRAKHGFAYPVERFLAKTAPADLIQLRKLYPEAALNLETLSPLNRSAKKFMLWSLEHNLTEMDHAHGSL